MITIKEIALKAGVAKSTVSNVLSGKKYVSPEIADKVLKICKENDYHPNFFASTLSAKGKTNIIGLFLNSNFDDIYEQLYADLIQAVLKELSIKGKSLLIYSNIGRDETTLKMQAGKAPIDGAIIFQPTINDSRILDFNDQVIPFVLIGHPENSFKTNYVDVDNTKLTNTIATQMIEKGFHSICLLNSSKEMVISKEREYGFMCAFEGKNAKFAIKHNNNTIDDGYKYAYECIKEGTDAFITSNGAVALGVYKAAKELNKEIGKDIVVFALGYSKFADGKFEPSLSYAIQDYFMLGKRAVEILISNIEGNKGIVTETIDNQIHYHKSFR